MEGALSKPAHVGTSVVKVFSRSAKWSELIGSKNDHYLQISACSICLISLIPWETVLSAEALSPFPVLEDLKLTLLSYRLVFPFSGLNSFLAVS